MTDRTPQQFFEMIAKMCSDYDCRAEITLLGLRLRYVVKTDEDKEIERRIVLGWIELCQSIYPDVLIMDTIFRITGRSPHVKDGREQ